MLQSLIVRLFPRLAPDIEAESRSWRVQCPVCGNEKSIWDVGGVRYKALGTVRRLGHCSRCRRIRMLRIYRSDT